MTKRKVSILILAILALLVAVAGWLFGAPTIGTVTMTPTTVGVNTATTITVTASINDPLLLPESITLIRITPASSTVVGLLHDDGLAGDAVAGDHVFTAQLALNEPYPTIAHFQVSAAFKGMLRRVTSSPITITVQGLQLSSLLTTMAPSVVHGTVSSLFSYYTGTLIFSDLTISTLSTIKGPSVPAIIIVHVKGGTVGTDSQHDMGSLAFATGQELVLFVSGPDVKGRYTVPIGSLGVFRIDRSSPSGALARIDPGYSFMDLSFPLDPSYAALLDRSTHGQLTLNELLAVVAQQ